MEQALHTNLLLLGIDSTQCQPPFGAGMFRVTHPRGTQFVLHFLLTTLKPDAVCPPPPASDTRNPTALAPISRLASRVCRHSPVCGPFTTPSSPATSGGCEARLEE
jgi:hypothetical protein